MLYAPELYYIQDENESLFKDAVRVTATAVGRWCSHYRARLIVPTSRDFASTVKSGALPADPQEKEAFVAALVHWIFEHSVTYSLFCLRLDDKPVLEQGGRAKFDHHDDTGCWTLELGADEFAALQAAWQAHGLPQDLFYPEGETVLVPYPGKGLLARLFRAFGGSKFYTPKQWEHRAG
jgi:hypothetical protein